MGATSKLPPSSAIRHFCLACMGNSPAMVTACDSKLCPLVSFRMGRGGAGALKAIRLQCLQCVETEMDVKECTGKLLFDQDCTLWPYRFGKNPALKGIRGGGPGNSASLAAYRSATRRTRGNFAPISNETPAGVH